MSLHLIPAALRGHGRRRAADKVTELRQENRKLLNWIAAADDFFQQQDAYLTELETGLAQANKQTANEEKRRKAAEAELAQAEEVIRLRDQRIADLARRLDIGVKAEHVIAKTQENDFRSLQARFASGRVVSLPNSPLAQPAQH